MQRPDHEVSVDYIQFHTQWEHKMQQQTNDSKDSTVRPEWFGYAQLGLILLVIAIALYFARAPGRVQLDMAPAQVVGETKPAVNVIRPAPTEQALTVKLTGSVRAYDKVVVRSEVAGRVVWVSPDFTNGGSVTANEAFVRIDPTRYELKVEAAEMAVSQAQNTGAAQTALKLAQLDLARTEISLPYDARVISSSVSVGELVGPVEGLDGAASILGIVYQPSILAVDVPVDPKVLEYLTPVIDRAATVHIRAETYSASVNRISSVVAPQTRMASLFLRFAPDHPPESLPLPGSFVEVEIEGPAYQDVFVLPDSVLQEGDSVWTVQDGVLRSLTPQALGRVGAGLVVEAFDAGEGIIAGILPGAGDGLAVQVAETLQ